MNFNISIIARKCYTAIYNIVFILNDGIKFVSTTDICRQELIVTEIYIPFDGNNKQ